MSSGKSARDRTSRRRLIGIGLSMVMVMVVIAYALLLTAFSVISVPTEQRFEARQDAAALDVYAATITMDPVRETIRLRVAIFPGAASGGGRPRVPERDITVLVASPDSVEELVFPANQETEPHEIGFDFRTGHVVDYPFDRYVLPISVRAFAGRPPALGRELTTRLTIWSHINGFTSVGAPVPPAEGSGVAVRLELRRNGMLVWFACVVYIAMAVMSLCGLAVGVLVFVRVRRPDAPLISAAAAMIFAEVTLRSAMPGSPPLGVLADILVLMWVEVFAVIGLGLMVYTWATEGPRP